MPTQVGIHVVPSLLWVAKSWIAAFAHHDRERAGHYANSDPASTSNTVPVVAVIWVTAAITVCATSSA